MKQKTIKEYKEQIRILRICLVVTAVIGLVMIVVDNFSSKQFINTENVNCINPCNFITSTPSWIKEGYLIGSGYSPNITTELLINENITFVYRDSCGWCDEQKKTLDINLLNKSGLLLKC